MLRWISDEFYSLVPFLFPHKLLYSFNATDTTSRFLLLQMNAHLQLCGSEQAILVSQVFSTVGLSKCGDSSWVQSSGLGGTSRSDTEAKRGVIHTVNNNTLVLRAVLRPTSNVCLDNVASVKERHLSVGLNPDLVTSVLRKDWKSGDMKAEFSSFGELA